MMRTIMTTFTCLLVLSAVAAGQNSSLLDRERRAQPVADETGTPQRTGFVSMIATPAPEPRSFAVEDLVTIIVREQATHTTESDTSTERESTLSAAVNEWIKLTGSNWVLGTDPLPNGTPSVDGEISREFEGSGEATRTDSLTMRIQARVIDVKPNGNLVLEASRRIQTDDDAYTTTLTGTCRAEDITADNTVLSTQLAELEVVKVSEGTVRDASRRSLLQELFDWVNLL